MREADANKLKLTPQFLELKFIEAIANNSKMFFGEKVRRRFPTLGLVLPTICKLASDLKLSFVQVFVGIQLLILISFL